MEMNYEEKYNEILEWARKNKARLNGVPIEEVLPELRESEDERITRAINNMLPFIPDEAYGNNGVTKEGVLNWLEKQKEQKPVEHRAFEEWAEYYWSHNKVNNPYSYNKGDEIQFDHKGFVSFCEAYCYPQNLVLHDTFGYEEGRQTGQNEGVKLVLNNPEKYGLQKEQKPNFSEKDSTDFEIEVHEIITQARNDSRLDDADVLKQFEEEAAFALMLKANKLIEQKPTEWSEEDERMRNALWNLLHLHYAQDYAQTLVGIEAGKFRSWLKSLKPSWKPSEEQIKALYDACCIAFEEERDFHPSLSRLYHDLRKL